MITSKKIEAAVEQIRQKAILEFGNCPFIAVCGASDGYNITISYSSDDKDIEWTVFKGVKGDDVIGVITNDLYGYVRKVYAVAEDKTPTLLDKFMEVRDKFPFMAFLGKREETMHGEILTWCRDYFGGPKNEMLAYLIAGYWQNKIECEQSSKERDRLAYAKMYSDMEDALRSLSYSDHAWEMGDDEVYKFDEPLCIKHYSDAEIEYKVIKSVYYDRGNESIRIECEDDDYSWSEISDEDRRFILKHFNKEYFN